MVATTGQMVPKYSLHFGMPTREAILLQNTTCSMTALPQIDLVIGIIDVVRSSMKNHMYANILEVNQTLPQFFLFHPCLEVINPFQYGSPKKAP